MKSLTLISLLCASVFLAGCARDRDVAQTVKNPELQGKSFVSESCSAPLDKEISNLGAVDGQKTVFSFRGARITRETVYYAKNDCTGTALFTLRETGDYSTNKSAGVKSNDNGNQMDINWNTLEGVVHQKEGVEAANKGLGLCGIKTWPMNKPVNITNKAKDTLCYRGELPRQDHNLYRLDDGDKTLLIARLDKKANKPNERPASLQGAEKYRAK